MRIFPECDPSCKEPARLFFGGKKLLPYTDSEACFNPVQLVREMCRYISESDKAHAASKIKKYCEDVGLDMRNGLPKVIQQVDTDDADEEEGLAGAKDDMEKSKIGEIAGSPIYKYIIGVPAKSPNLAFLFCFSKDNTYSPKAPRKYQIANEKLSKEYIEKFPFNQLENACQLWRKFSKGQYWAYHLELTGIAMNLLAIKGGRKRFIEALEQAPYQYKVDQWQYYCDSFVKYDYAPMQCDHYCPHKDTCQHNRNMIDQVILPKGVVRELQKQQYKSLAQAEEELRQHMNRILAEKNHKIYVIKAPTGIGKTRLYENLSDVTIACPTHNLCDEVSQRLTIPHRRTPKLPEDDKLEYLYSIGSYMLANQYIRQEAKQGNIEYQAYLNQCKLTKNYSGTLLTTHDKLLAMDIRTDTVIVDEDIITKLLPIGTTTLQDLETMAEECCYFDTRHTLESIVRPGKVAVPSGWNPRLVKPNQRPVPSLWIRRGNASN